MARHFASIMLALTVALMSVACSVPEPARPDQAAVAAAAKATLTAMVPRTPVPQAEILSHTSYAKVFTDQTQVHVIGEVRNRGPLALRWVQVVATFYDKAGQVVQVERAEIEIQPLPVGATSPFMILVWDTQPYDHYQVQTSWRTVD